MDNSWNIKDPIQYKLDLQDTYEPEFWQWIPNGQIVYSSDQKTRIFVDQEVVKQFTQDQARIKLNAAQGNMNKNAKKRQLGQWSQGNSLYLSLYEYDSR